MSDLETLLRDTLVSHGREAPPGHGLLASIRARESRRRHRTRLAAGSATVAVTATIITAAGLLDSKAPNRPTAAGLTSAPVTPGAARVSLATSPPTPRAGSTPTRPVSFRGVQVEVPRAWKLNDLRCGTPVHSTAIIGAGPYQPYCSAIERQGLTVVRIEAVASTFGQLRATVATHAMTVDGQPALRGTGAVPGLKTRVTALVLSRQGVVISVESPDPAAARRILGTARILTGKDAGLQLNDDLDCVSRCERTGRGYTTCSRRGNDRPTLGVLPGTLDNRQPNA